MKPEDLSPDDYFTFAIGRLARADVLLDNQVREHLYPMLMGGIHNEERWSLNRYLGPALEQCMGVLSAPGAYDLELVEAGNEALTFSIQAHNERNRYIHDHIGLIYGETALWARTKAQVKPGKREVHQVDIQAVEQAQLALVTARHRLYGLAQLVLEPGPDADTGWSDPKPSYWSDLRGEFVPHLDGSTSSLPDS